jgi:hypothetical protein
MPYLCSPIYEKFWIKEEQECNDGGSDEGNELFLFLILLFLL